MLMTLGVNTCADVDQDRIAMLLLDQHTDSKALQLPTLAYNGVQDSPCHPSRCKSNEMQSKAEQG